MSSEKKQSIRDAYAAYKKDPELNGPKLLKALENYREAWVSERRNTHERAWRENLAFYSGDHYIRDRSQQRVRVKENHVNNTLNRMISIFIQNLPITRVFPASIDFKDLQDAESTELYLKYFWRTKKLEQRYGKLIKYTTIFGSAFKYRAYDPEAGGKLLLDSSETKSGDPEVRLYRGDVKVSVDDPFKIAVRPGIDELDDMYDFIRSVPANRSELEATHGKLEAESATGLNAYNGQTREDDELVMVHHYHHKPTPWFEEGLYVCWAGKRLLRVRDASECEAKLPLEHLPFDRTPMRFYGMATIEQMMDLQEQINRASSMIVEARNLVARPRVLVANEAQVPGQALSDRPGEIIRYKLAGGPPKFEVPNFKFGEMASHKADLRNAIAQVSGMTSASRGEVPAATRTALALQLVLEQDRSQFLPFIKAFHQTILDGNAGILDIAAEYFAPEDPRVIKVEGDSMGSRTFHGGMVPSPLDIYLEDTNPLGWTAGGRVESVLELVDRGVITDRNQVLSMLRLNSPDPAFELLNINKQAALREIDLLNKGQILDIGPEDDDAIHLDEHVKVAASFSFRNKPEAVRRAHEDHINRHKARIGKAAQGAAPGPEGGPGIRKGGDPGPRAPKGLALPDPGQDLEKLLTK